jgi:diketogulonate reductase-like aldo/keto reductase
MCRQAIYGNEKSVGVGLKESGLDRSDFYLTTKYDGGDIQKAMRDSLEKVGACSAASLLFAQTRTQLGVKSVDLYLIHFPKVVTAIPFSF